MKSLFITGLLLVFSHVFAAVVPRPNVAPTPAEQPAYQSFAEYLRTHRSEIDPARPAYETGVVLIKVKPEVGPVPEGALGIGVSKIDAFLASLGAYKISHALSSVPKNNAMAPAGSQGNGLAQIYAVSYLANQDPVEVSERLALDPNVEFAEPSPIRYTTSCPANDYDPGLKECKQIKVTHCDEAWNTVLACDNTRVIIAIVDSGVDITHSDLVNLLWVNPDEGTDVVQGAHNGVDLVGSVSDAEAQNGIFRPDGSPMPGLDHGTHVAGLADAEVNNGSGFCGTGYNCKLMSIKCGTNNTNGSAIYRGYDGIWWAVQHHADIINCSWGGPGISQTEQLVINAAFDANSVVVVAAGNSLNNNDINVFGPASLNRVLSVGAVDINNNTEALTPASFSDYGTSVRTWAPGVQLYSTLPGNTYGPKDGTSMASPVVAGIAALVRSWHPDFNADQVAEQVHVNSTVPFNVGTPNTLLYYGMVDAYQAVSNETLPGVVMVAASGAAPSDTVNLQVTLKNLLTKSGNLQATLTLTGSNPNLLLSTNHHQSYGEIPTLGSSTKSFTVYLKNGATRAVGKFLLTLQDGSYYTDYLLFTATITHSGLVSWNLNSPVDSVLQSVRAINDNLAWAAGGGGAQNQIGVVYHTQDGATWTEAVAPNSNATVGKMNYFCVDAVQAPDQTQRVWMGSNTSGGHKASVVYSTYSDTAKTPYAWHPVDVSSITSFVNSIHFFNASQGIFTGDPTNGVWGIGKTVDGGRTWTPLATPVSSVDSGWNNAADWVGGRGWFGTSTNKIYRTVDSGRTWTPYQTQADSSEGIAFANTSIGIAFFNPAVTGGGGTLERSTDGGLNWDSIPGPGSNPRYTGIVYSKGTRNVWVCGSEYSGSTIVGSFVYNSTNNGDSWTSQKMPQTSLTIPMNHIAIGLGNKGEGGQTNLSGWMVGRSIVDFNQQVVVGVKSPSAGAINPQAMQCYPNPFSGRTLLSAVFTGSKRAVSLKVYNAIGQTVDDLSSQLRHADALSVSALWDATRLQDGIYYAVLRCADGSVLSTPLSVVRQ